MHSTKKPDSTSRGAQVTVFTAGTLRRDLPPGVLEAARRALGEYVGVAHFLALDAREDLCVAETLNWRVQPLVVA